MQRQRSIFSFLHRPLLDLHVGEEEQKRSSLASEEQIPHWRSFGGRLSRREISRPMPTIAINLYHLPASCTNLYGRTDRESLTRDYNQTHFVRNLEFKEAAVKLQGPLWQIFVEFLERSYTVEFSGFLLYKELGRRLKKTNPVVAEIFSLMSRDEGRDAVVEAIGQIEELLSEIYAVGGKDKGSFLGSFSKEAIETSFNVDSDEVLSLFEQESRKLMVKATKEQISTISKAL
ncbi:hypothetical protein J5N97_020188 [Dioscorea zingiberensis]|uniref:Rubrerythrin diiron-binding domain-containing protein n=1 Tax=Dioscorea zingiberensis TaxID=325984 RepID=A0A9D5HD69_9LILI|nr:hypothetical protein J5N97_020188 [Dioscorea zingiberensis]